MRYPQATNRGRWLRDLAAGLLVLCLGAPVPRGLVMGASALPSIAFATRPGHSLAVTGRNWGRHVIVTAQIGGSQAGAALGTAAGGKFVLALDFSVACGGISVEVRDLGGHDETLKRPGPLCPNRLGEPPPAMTVLQGLTSKVHVRTIASSTVTRSVTMRVGETLGIIVPGGTTPSFLPTADSRHFQLLRHAGTGSTSCTAACPPTGDQIWEWVAIKRGNGAVTLSPACRQSRPPCELPERVMEVIITR